MLLDERIGLISGRRLALLTDQAGVDEHGTPDAELLANDARARKARVTLLVHFTPEDGSPFPDSTLRGVQTMIVDLQDVGTRGWSSAGMVVSAMRAAARHQIPVLVLDRPNPITGSRVEGPLLDSALVNANDLSSAAPGKASALYPGPLRHGMTIGELARLLNARLDIGAELTVVPMRGWHRDQWFDRTGLPWVRLSPNITSLTSALLYPALVAFEATNLSVGSGTSDAYQRVGAPWLKARDVVELLRDRPLPGVKFDVESFIPESPSDGKYAGHVVAGIRIRVTDRERVNAARVGASLLWAIAKTTPESLIIDAAGFDLRVGAPRVRLALLRGEEPDAVLDRELPAVILFRESIKPFLLYR